MTDELPYSSVLSESVAFCPRRSGSTAVQETAVYLDKAVLERSSSIVKITLRCK
jgi:hypothetical protein